MASLFGGLFGKKKEQKNTEKNVVSELPPLQSLGLDVTREDRMNGVQQLADFQRRQGNDRTLEELYDQILKQINSGVLNKQAMAQLFRLQGIKQEREQNITMSSLDSINEMLDAKGMDDLLNIASKNNPQKQFSNNSLKNILDEQMRLGKMDFSEVKECVEWMENEAMSGLLTKLSHSSASEIKEFQEHILEKKNESERLSKEQHKTFKDHLNKYKNSLLLLKERLQNPTIAEQERYKLINEKETIETRLNYLAESTAGYTAQELLGELTLSRVNEKLQTNNMNQTSSRR